MLCFPVREFSQILFCEKSRMSEVVNTHAKSTNFGTNPDRRQRVLLATIVRMVDARPRGRLCRSQRRPRAPANLDNGDGQERDAANAQENSFAKVLQELSPAPERAQKP